MTNIRCPRCNESVPQAEYNLHMREKHATPTVQDMCRAKENYSLYYAMYHQQHSKPAPAATKPPSTSSSPDPTLHGSATDSSKMSTTFSAWQEQNKFAVTQSARCITADDVSSFRVDRSDQPRTAARSLQKSTKYDIQEFVSEFQELASEDREKCNDLIRKLPVFACLSAYIFTHLKLCVADPNLLDSFLLMTREWINKQEEWCLINYQTVKTDLTSFLEQGTKNLSGLSVDDEWESIRLPIPQSGCATFTFGASCRLKKYMITDLRQLLDIASGLEYLHAMQPTIVHGDLKSLNIFVTASERACLADFGLATVHDTQVSVATTVHGIYGTAGYMAPELISVWEDPNGATLLAQLDRRRCDMFAFGCITYEVYTGGPPFQGNNPTVRSQALLSGRRPQRPTEARAHELGLDDDMWMFIGSLWAHRPEARLVAESARDFLRYKLSAVRQSASRAQDDPEWETGFLSSLVVAKGLFML
ncbi:kinase-like domain-containing protein [Lanmaoa asiatica]|nr:kinase-like domain-containing protein [Lanmaoa asiatica]